MNATILDLTLLSLFDRGNALRGQRRIARDAEQIADAGERGVVIVAGVFGQQLMRGERAVGAPRDDVGERAAAVDPELPL